MNIWAELFEALNDVKVGYIFAMLVGYGLFRLTKGSTKAEEPSRDDDSITFNDDNMDYTDDETKMVLVVRSDLKMGKGKIAAQCCHGAVGCYRAALKHPKLLKAWEHEGQKKIAVKVENETALRELQKHAKSVGLLTNMVQDAGRTQIAAGSRTVLAIGPGKSSVIDQVTGHLKLF